MTSRRCGREPRFPGGLSRAILVEQYQPPPRWSPQWSFPTAADLDGDGDVDLAATSDRFLLFRNDGPEAGWVVSTTTLAIGGFDVVAGDWNGDGKVDLASPDSGRRALSILLNRTPPAPSPDDDWDGVPDECARDLVRFLRGDCNADGEVALSDVLCALDGLFAGGELPCRSALDTNGDNDVNISDPVLLLGGSGPFSMPAAPHAY